MKQIQKWGLFEAAVHGKSAGNPFLDYDITGTFTGEYESVTVHGFYDGEGIYRVRFMPSFEGRYTYTIHGSAMDSTEMGEFEATAPQGNNHGPVRTVEDTLLGYADGNPYYSIGTTCYAWVNQTMALQEQTLKNFVIYSSFTRLESCSSRFDCFNSFFSADNWQLASDN